MFLITSRANPSQKRTESPAPKSEQSLAKFSRARVQKACERCRVKKIKCNGEIPCQRCQQDEVFCTSRKREPGDLKAASRDYISTLESQQKTFITTLQKISRNYPQSIDVEGMREIVALAKSHGYEFEGTMDDHGVKPENGVSIEQRGIKRPRGNDAAIDMLRTTTADDTSSGDFLKTRSVHRNIHRDTSKSNDTNPTPGPTTWNTLPQYLDDIDVLTQPFNRITNNEFQPPGPVPDLESWPSFSEQTDFNPQALENNLPLLTSNADANWPSNFSDHKISLLDSMMANAEQSEYGLWWDPIAMMQN